MDDVIKATSRFVCGVCRKYGRSGARVVLHGDGLRHVRCEPVSDPAPTVEGYPQATGDMNTRK